MMQAVSRKERIIKTSTSNSLKCSSFKFALFLLSHYHELMGGGVGEGGVHMERGNASYTPIAGVNHDEFCTGQWTKCAPQLARSPVGQKRVQPSC